jgi:hypothetical protein
MNGLVQVLSLFRFLIPAVVHAHERGAGAAPDNLTDLSRCEDTSTASRHTNGTLRWAIQLIC